MRALAIDESFGWQLVWINASKNRLFQTFFSTPKLENWINIWPTLSLIITSDHGIEAKRVLNSLLGVFSLSPTSTRLASVFFNSSFNTMKSPLCYISLFFDNLVGQLTTLQWGARSLNASSFEVIAAISKAEMFAWLLLSSDVPFASKLVNTWVREYWRPFLPEVQKNLKHSHFFWPWCKILYPCSFHSSPIGSA